MRTEEIKLYSFYELSEEAKEYAINKCRESDGYIDYEWWEYTVYEDFHNILEILGYSDIKCYFSGFYSQGDGASFEANWSYSKGCLNKIKKYAPKDEELHNIAKVLIEIGFKNRWDISSKICKSGHYEHEYTMHIDYFESNIVEEPRLEDSLLEASRDLARWLYSRLEDQYDYLMSDKCIEENLQRNEYEFEEDGEMY
jgi:hypothetical protein